MNGLINFTIKTAQGFSRSHFYKGIGTESLHGLHTFNPEHGTGCLLYQRSLNVRRRPFYFTVYITYDGKNVGAKYEIYTFIHALAAEGKAVIVISSELPELLGITDRIYTIFEGEVTGCVNTADADQESLMRLMTSHVASN